MSSFTSYVNISPLLQQGRIYKAKGGLPLVLEKEKSGATFKMDFQFSL